MSSRNQNTLRHLHLILKIGQVNYKSSQQLRIFINNQHLDIICINETSLDDGVNNQAVEITGYDILRRDRKRNGGVVAIYLRNTIAYTERNDLIPESAKAICLEKKKNKK